MMKADTRTFTIRLRVIMLSRTLRGGLRITSTSTGSTPRLQPGPAERRETPDRGIINRGEDFCPTASPIGTYIINTCLLVWHINTSCFQSTKYILWLQWWRILYRKVQYLSHTSLYTNISTKQLFEYSTVWWILYNNMGTVKCASVLYCFIKQWFMFVFVLNGCWILLWVSEQKHC